MVWLVVIFNNKTVPTRAMIRRALKIPMSQRCLQMYGETSVITQSDEHIDLGVNKKYFQRAKEKEVMGRTMAGQSGFPDSEIRTGTTPDR